jgi:hypothetical protein
MQTGSGEEKMQSVREEVLGHVFSARTLAVTHIVIMVDVVDEVAFSWK